MYELTLASNNYGVINTKDNEIGISISPVMLDEGLLSLTNIKNDDDLINVFDINFRLGVKKADKLDYLAATFSGSLAYAIHHFITGKKKNNIDFDNLTEKDLIGLTTKLLQYYNLSDEKIKSAEEKINENIYEVADKLNKATKYKSLAIDFARGLSYKALLISILESVLGIEIGKDTKGNVVINKVEDKTLADATIIKRVEIGFIKWLIKTTSDYKESGKFEEEINDVLKIKGGIKKLSEIIKELADTKFFKDKDFDESELIKYFVGEINNTKENDEEQKYDFINIIKKQSIPVMFNKAFVRAYYFIRTFIEQATEHGTNSIEGLEVLNLAKVYKENQRVVARLDTVSTTIFAALDIVPAAGAGIYAGYNAFKMNYVPVGEEHADAVAAIIAALKGIKEGGEVFASTINFANIGEFVTVIKVDRDYLIEDIKGLFNKTKLIEVKEVEFTKLSDEEISNCLGLNNNETKILYSLELDLVESDIQKTKKSDVQIRKNDWKKEWKNKSIEALNLKKLFIEDKDKLYATIKTHKATTDDLWLLKVLIELMQFKPYCQLSEDNKKYKGLKLAYTDYVKEIVCKEQKVVEEKAFSSLSASYKKNNGQLSGSTIKTTAMIAGAAILTIGTAGAAFAFAPAIAVGLVGGSFAGLSGAALTSASLALVGGGAVAAGGFGMAGGAVIIAGGGALLGLGTSGATAAAFAMMSTSSFVLEDYSKLLTKCDVLLNVFNKRNEVANIQVQIETELGSAKVRLDVLKNTIELDEKNKKERKSLIKEQEHSIEIMEKANDALIKMLNKFDKKSI